MHRSKLALILCGCLACPSDDSDSDTAADDGGTAATQTGAESSTADGGSEAGSSGGSGGDGSSGGGDGAACTEHNVSLEGCGVAGCAAGPTNLDGTLAVGATCSEGIECAATLCTCASDATAQYFAVDCACGVCADASTACEQTAGGACP